MVLALSKRGCPALMRAYTRMSEDERAVLDAALFPHMAWLTCDERANYLVQEVVQRLPAAAAEAAVVACMGGHLAALAADKHGSNVVQAALRACRGSAAVRELAAAELVRDVCVLRDLVRDPYGNFVLQTLLETACTLGELEALAAPVRRVVVGSPFATNIMAKATARHAALTRGRPVRLRVAVVQRCGGVRRTLVYRERDSAPTAAPCEAPRRGAAGCQAALVDAAHGALEYRHDPWGCGRVVFAGSEGVEW